MEQDRGIQRIEDANKYSFEHDTLAHSRRAREQALADLRKLFARLAVAPTDATMLIELPLLVRYAMDVHGNIAWYERAKRRALLGQYLVLVAVISLGVAAMAYTAWTAVLVPDDAEAPFAITQAAIFVALAYGVVQVLAGLADQKAKLTGFAKASADLKEALYTFEETWRSKPLLTGGAIDPDFETAVLQEVANARRFARAERDAYFGNIASASDVAKTLDGVLASVGRNAQALGELRRSRAEAADKARGTAAENVASERRRLIEAKAAARARREKLARLQAAGTPEQLATARSELLDAEIAELEARARFAMIVKGEMLNPG